VGFFSAPTESNELNSFRGHEKTYLRYQQCSVESVKDAPRVFWRQLGTWTSWGVWTCQRMLWPPYLATSAGHQRRRSCTRSSCCRNWRRRGVCTRISCRGGHGRLCPTWRTCRTAGGGNERNASNSLARMYNNASKDLPATV
jgi:hypothetical protein